MKPFKTPADWLAPIRASHLIQLDTYTDTRNFVHIWLPEMYGREPHRCGLLDKTEDRRFKMSGDSLVTTLAKPGSFEICGKVYPIEDGVGLELSITNISPDVLPEGSANVCVQFAAAPSFIDVELNRYFYVHNGQIEFFHQPYQNFENNHAWFYGTAPTQPHCHNPEPDFGFIGLASKDGAWVVGHGWNTARKIWGNCHPSISCIHADPWFGPILPGETALSHGVLYFMKGTPQTCADRFVSEFRKR